MWWSSNTVSPSYKYSSQGGICVCSQILRFRKATEFAASTSTAVKYVLGDPSGPLYTRTRILLSSSDYVVMVVQSRLPTLQAKAALAKDETIATSARR